MKKNYEIKCRVNDFSGLRKKIRKIKGVSCSVEKQTDDYFKIRKGRLKLRVINDSIGNLIYYFRDEQTGRRISKYVIVKTNNFKELELILKKQFHFLVKVIKKREIYIFDSVRIHLDTVSRLGKFIEIEIIYNNLSKAKTIMTELIRKLEIDKKIFIKESYSDLLIKRK